LEKYSLLKLSILSSLSVISYFFIGDNCYITSSSKLSLSLLNSKYESLKEYDISWFGYEGREDSFSVLTY
jgi:hypothetical protein